MLNELADLFAGARSAFPLDKRRLCIPGVYWKLFYHENGFFTFIPRFVWLYAILTQSNSVETYVSRLLLYYRIVAKALENVLRNVNRKWFEANRRKTMHLSIHSLIAIDDWWLISHQPSQSKSSDSMTFHINL